MFYVYFEEHDENNGIREFETKQGALDFISDRLELTGCRLYSFKLIEGQEIDLDLSVKAVERKGVEVAVHDNAHYAIRDYLRQLEQHKQSPNVFKKPKKLDADDLQSALEYLNESGDSDES